MARSHGIVYNLSQVHYIVMKTTRKSLTEKIKAVALATGLSVLPAKEVNSGISYGGSVGVDFNGNVSIGGQILSVNNPNSVYGKIRSKLGCYGERQEQSLYSWRSRVFI